MSLGEKIRLARLEKKMLQKDLANFLTENGFKTTNATISNWELNISEPDMDTLDAICQILNKDANYFFEKNKRQDSIDTSDLNDEEILELLHYKDFIKSKRKVDNKDA